MASAQPIFVPSGRVYSLTIRIAKLPRNRDGFFDFCQENPDWRLELTTEGEIVAMVPVGFEGGYQEREVGDQLSIWVRRDGTGIALHSNVGFKLPNGETRAPDASWVRKSRAAELSAAQKKKFA